MRKPEVERVIAAVSVSEIGRHICALEGVRHPTGNPKGLQDAARHITATFESQGHEVTEHLFMEDGVEYPNIIATITGRSRPEERLIIMAHYDTVADSNGADDNASGVAVLLELGRILGAIQPSGTIQLIAVTLEEKKEAGLPSSPITRGSRALAAHAKDNRWNIAGIVVLEAVAFADSTCFQSAPTLLRGITPEIGDFIAVVGNKSSAVLVREFEKCLVCSRVDLKECSLTMVYGNGEGLPDGRRPDHAPCWDSGSKTIMLTDSAEFRSPH